MQQASQHQPTSIRLSSITRDILDEAAKQTKRSRSYLVEETLKNYLTLVVKKERQPSQQERIARLKALQGSGAAIIGNQSVESIDTRIRVLRGDE
jgi:RHH-type transcriptional regulator, rel operon repressor / antitoxin RelB